MAQVTRFPACGLLALAIAAAVQATPAQAAAPQAASAPMAGLRAEGEGRWAEAAQVYRQALARDPAQPALWERLADILALRLDAPAEAADALASAARHAPRDARLHQKLSQAQAVAGRPSAALAAIDRALELDPDNAGYLRARAELATWNGDRRQALDSYERLLARPDAGDAAALHLGAARAAAGLGESATAVRHYDAYLAAQPRDQAVLLEAMDFVAGQGDAATLRRLDAHYRDAFGTDPAYATRRADLYAVANDAGATTEALEQAVQQSPADAALLHRLAEQHAGREDPAAAQQAIERALALDPDNLDYLRFRAEMANWRGDYAAALDSYARILAVAPDDADARLGTARVHYWRGEPAEADRGYRAYLERQPDVAVAWLEHAAVVAEMGDPARADAMLQRYRERFGENEAYRKQRARVLAWGGRPDAALALATGLQGSAVDDHELAYTRAIALHHARRPREALAELSALEQQRPDNREVAELGRFLRTPHRSNLGVGIGYASGSDDVDARRLSLRGELVLSPVTALVARAQRQRIAADAGSGFAADDGDTDLDLTTGWVGVRHRLSPRIAFDAEVGNASAAGHDHVVYGIGADLRPADGWTARLSRVQDTHAVSPLAIDRGIVRRANAFDVSWSPDMRYTVDASVQYDTFSDGNDRRGVQLAPRRAVLRRPSFSLDLGVAAHWYGFDHDPGNGYYAPTQYRRYAGTAMAYWTLGPDDGIAVTASLGPYKDNTMSGYRTGSDFSLTGFFGTYRDWFLQVGVGYSDYGGTGAGGYRGGNVTLNLTRRF